MARDEAKFLVGPGIAVASWTALPALEDGCDVTVCLVDGPVLAARVRGGGRHPLDGAFDRSWTLPLSGCSGCLLRVWLLVGVLVAGR